MPSSIPFPLGNSCHNCRNIPSSSLCPADGNLGVRKSISAFQSHIPLQMQGTIQTSTPIPQKLSGKALPHSRRAGLAALGRRPGATRWRILPIKQINLQIPAPVLNFLRCKKSKTVPGAGILPVGGDRGAKRTRPPEAASRQNPNSGWTMPNSSSPSGGGT